MGSSRVIALQLDREMLDARSVTVYGIRTAVLAMPPRDGLAVFGELGGRWLLHYTSNNSAAYYQNGLRASRDRPAFFTPTAVPAHDLDTLLALPGPRVRSHVLYLDPRGLEEIRGPRWVRTGMGIEYVVTADIPLGNLIPPGWPVPVA